MVSGNYSGYVIENDFSSFITSNCGQWRNYSTYSHEFYNIMFAIYLILGLFKPYFNYHIKFNWSYEGWDFFFDERLIDYLQWIILGIIFLRIFQVYWISVLYLGGL